MSLSSFGLRSDRGHLLLKQPGLSLLIMVAFCMCFVFLNGDASISVTEDFCWLVETAVVIEIVAGLRFIHLGVSGST